MDGPPPPPPPHGEKPNTTHGEYRKASDLPPGNYDIFIIPPHSSGSGFLYLPSLQCHRNSFIAGSLCTLFAVLLWFTLAPILKSWYSATIANGSGMGIALLAIGVGVAGWAFGASQADSGSQRGPGFGGFGSGPGSGGASSQSQSSGTGGNYSHGSNFGGPNGGQSYRGGFSGGTRSGSQYGNQHGGPPPHAHPNDGPPPRDAGGNDWDRAREETKRKEEIRRKMEEFKRKREADAREKQRQREREEMEREFKEREKRLQKEIAEAKERAEKEAREKAQREATEAKARQEKEEAEAKAKREKEVAEAKAKAEKEAAEKEAAAKAAAKKEADAKFNALKEAAAKKYAEKKAKDAKDAQDAASKESSSRASRTPSHKKPPFPTARTATEDDAYSFRPYDRPRRPYGTSGSSVSESSYAPSHSTAPTTPPQSHRSAYSTKDPDKIVIQGVYSFNNAFLKTPIAHLVSGQGMVTDGLVLRITTEGLFIDDDVRGVPQREWDVKAWTLKLAEVWCPQFGPNQPNRQPPKSNPFRWGSSQTTPTPEESDACLANLLKVCKNTCRLASPACFSRNGGGIGGDSAEQRGLHVLRASFRDQEGKRYVFVLQETEGWKVPIGLQRLRRGTQVRALGVSSMPMNDCKSILGNLGYI